MRCWNPSSRSQFHQQFMRPFFVNNFTNILRAAFVYQSSAQSLFVLTFYVCTFLAQKYWHICAIKLLYEKAGGKMLVKFTPGALKYLKRSGISKSKIISRFKRKQLQKFKWHLDTLKLYWNRPTRSVIA